MFTNFIKTHSNQQGLTLIEVLITVGIASLIIVGLNGLIGGVYDHWQHSNSRQNMLSQGNFAMSRIVQSVHATRRVLIPLGENPGTAHLESERNVLAITLDPGLDRDVDGFFDADNDKDGLIDEDIPADNTFDGVPGIIGIDDDNDGTIDENIGGGDWFSDNDEDGFKREDFIDNIDNDNDGAIDEDIPKLNSQSGGDANNNADNDGDGLKNEDWFDAVVYFISPDNTQLIERIPDINPIDGTDYTEHPIVEADKIEFSVVRLPIVSGDKTELLEISLTLTDTNKEQVNLQTRLRIGGGK